MAKHPFNKGTQLAKVFTILSDGNWHCGKHELPGTQPAKIIQTIRHHGFEIKKKSIYCNICEYRTVHRKLVSTEAVAVSFIRQQLPSKLRKRVLQYYKKTEAITLRAMGSQQLEVDHRFPQIRWSRDESYNSEMSDKELNKKFQLLTRQNNLWKSRYCEKCSKTGERGTFIGINFFAEGEATWDPQFAKDDESGCHGCFWYDPKFWREALNELLAQNDKSE